MSIEIVGVYSSETQLIDDLNERNISSGANSYIHFFTVDPVQYQFLKEKTLLEGSLLENSISSNDSGIHGLATAFDENDGYVELMRLEKELQDYGLSRKDAIECSTYLHKGLIVVTEKV
ncbi:hypothetical protein V1502_08705 [Bacillus sp. SCS-153A]|uniref:hypothetical protein n=1 Tax=Rossellomorea sedimentorum TaxID=3115294 RepID=UPI0039067398